MGGYDEDRARSSQPSRQPSSFVHVRGAREHNLKDVSLVLPRDALVVFTGVSGSGKSSLAFGTLYAEAQRRYLESVSPYARRLFDQMQAPDVDAIEGLPPAIALQQQRGAPGSRSSVGSLTTVSNLLRILYSRAGTYPRGRPMLHAEDFSPNTPQGACVRCHGLGRIYDVTERSLVPDDTLTIRERAIAAWPPAWHGQNLRDILTTLGHDVDVPWRKLPKSTRDWILFTDEQPTVPVWAGYDLREAKRARRNREEPSYMGTFTSARKYVLETFAKTDSARMKKRAARFLVNDVCPTCEGKRLKEAALEVTLAGLDISALSALPMTALRDLMARVEAGREHEAMNEDAPEKTMVARRIAADLVGRLDVLLELGLGHLSIDRATPSLSPGELQRLRIGTQVRSNLFGVAYVLDEPSAGLHPADTEALLRALDRLKGAGNSLFIVEHELDVIRHADWVVDVGPGAGVHGGEIVYSGALEGLARVTASETARHLFHHAPARPRTPRRPSSWLKLRGVGCNNLDDLDVDLPLGAFTSVTGVSGSGKSSLVSQALTALLARARAGAGEDRERSDDDTEPALADDEALLGEPATATDVAGRVVAGLEGVRRVVRVDQRPIGRTPRSNLATYTGLFDPVRKLFASTRMARARKYDAGQFSFNVAQPPHKPGRCRTCAGEGFVFVELLFLPSVYSPCPACHGARYDGKTLEVKVRERSIADVLAMTVADARLFFEHGFEEESAVGCPSIRRSLDVLHEVGLDYLRLGQPATELSGGEAQRIKLATELQRANAAGTLYVLDEPTTGLHPSDVDKLVGQLHDLVDAGSTVIVVEHDMSVIARSDWVIDMGPGAGDEGGGIVAAGTPDAVARSRASRTAPYLRRALADASGDVTVSSTPSGVAVR